MLAGMDAPDLDNRTDFVVHPQVLADRDGERLVVVVKATFELEGSALEPAPPERMRGVRLADVPWDPEIPASIAYPCDLALRKPATDVVVVGRAHAPGGRPTPRFEARLEVGPLRRALAVFGPREWAQDGLAIGPAQPATEIPLQWDLAWGGFDDSDPEDPREEPRNPVGRGVARRPESLTGAAAPQIEELGHPITSRDVRGAPAGLGPIGRHFAPRRGFAGTYDGTWKEHRAPLLPDDYDDRHAQVAPPAQIVAAPLDGAAPVRLVHLTPRPTVAFALPAVVLEVGIDVRGREPVRVRPRLDTVLVDTLLAGGDGVTVELAWRTSVKAPRRQRDARIAVREVRS